MTQSKLPITERESVVLQTIKKHGEISQNALLEELAPQMAGNTARSMLKSLKARGQADYVKKKNSYIWFVIEVLSKDATEAEEEAEMHRLMVIELRVLRDSYKKLPLAKKLARCRQIAQLCFMSINGRILNNLEQKAWHESVDQRYIAYLRVLLSIIFSSKDDAELVYRAVIGHVLRIPIENALSSESKV